MDARGTLHLVEDDLTERWIDDTLAAVDVYLAKVAAFQAYLEGEVSDAG